MDAGVNKRMVLVRDQMTAQRIKDCQSGHVVAVDSPSDVRVIDHFVVLDSRSAGPVRYSASFTYGLGIGLFLGATIGAIALFVAWAAGTP